MKIIYTYLLLISILGGVASQHVCAKEIADKNADPVLMELETRMEHVQSGKEHNLVMMDLSSYWDHRLNKSYQALLAFFSQSPKKATKIKEMQRKWLSYKEASMTTISLLLNGDEKVIEGGQWFESNYLSTLIDITKNQCLFLEYLLETCKANNLQ